MVTLTQKEKQNLLVLFKDFTSYYNANSISKVLGISRIGSMKMLKKFLNEKILISKSIGKSTIYKLRLEDDYVRKLIAFLLADEANNFRRWKEEFKELFKNDRIILIYGSATRNYEKANDIDIMSIIDQSEYKEVIKVIEKRQRILPKKIHSIELTPNDLLVNIKDGKKPIIEIIKTAIVLYGQDKYVEILKNVASF
jgi:hypothetical protein